MNSQNRFHFYSAIPLTAVFCMVVSAAFAQSDLPNFPGGANPVRSPNAVLVLRSVVEALGGAAIPQIKDCAAEGTSQIYIGHVRPPENLNLENAGMEYRYAGSNGDVIVSGHGNPIAEDHKGKRTPLSRRTAWGNFSPHLAGLYLYGALSDSRYTVVDGGSTLVKGRPAVVIMTKHQTGVAKHENDSVTAQKWFIDPATHIPLKIEIIVPGARDGGVDAVRTVELAGYKQVNGVLVPFQFSYFMFGKLEAITTLSSVRFNVGLPASEFEIGGGGQ